MRKEKIEQHYRKAKAEYEYYRDAKILCEECQTRELGNYPECVFVAYMKIGDVNETANFLNELGFRRENGNKFLGVNVSEIIQSATIDDERLMRMARSLNQGGREFMNKLYN